jgi:putative glycosyltransferase (TIGR04348 family)
MRVCLVTPAPAQSRKGNRVTADRWAGALAELGHDVVTVGAYDDRDCDVLVALHAHRSADSVTRFRALYPERSIVVAMTGTDLYRDIHTSAAAQRALEDADRYVVLQELGMAELPAHLRSRARVIHQSVPASDGDGADSDSFDVAVLAHLREVKDPLRAAFASRLLPEGSAVRVVHAGKALEESYAEQARAEDTNNPRYTWLGEVDRGKALAVLARSWVLVVSSTMEGGANVVSEALAAGVPVLASRIPGSVGLLGEDYPGYFPVGDTEALAELLARAEQDRDGFYGELSRQTAELAWLVDPATERRRWAELLAELGA